MNRKTNAGAVFLLLLGTGAIAQEGTMPAGGTVSGTGGELSYSIGQVFYTADSGSNAFIIKGVQQPYEISNPLGIVSIDKNEIRVYPNPVVDYLTLKVADAELTDLSLYLYNLEGKLLEIRQIVQPETLISMGGLPPSTYFLKITDKNATIQTFKIIKK